MHVKQAWIFFSLIVMGIIVVVVGTSVAKCLAKQPFTSYSVKRVCQRSADVVGFLRVLRFPPTGKVDNRWVILENNINV